MVEKGGLYEAVRVAKVLQPSLILLGGWNFTLE